MSSLSPWRRAIAALVPRCLIPAARVSRPPLPALKQLCVEIVHDVHPGQKHALMHRIDHTRHPGELWFLRGRLYDAVALRYGEPEAKRRIERLDRSLR